MRLAPYFLLVAPVAFASELPPQIGGRNVNIYYQPAKPNERSLDCAAEQKTVIEDMFRNSHSSLAKALPEHSLKEEAQKYSIFIEVNRDQGRTKAPAAHLESTSSFDNHDQALGPFIGFVLNASGREKPCHVFSRAEIGTYVLTKYRETLQSCAANLNLMVGPKVQNECDRIVKDLDALIKEAADELPAPRASRTPE